MSNDFDFNEPTKKFKKIDFSKTYYSPSEGNNTVRIVDGKGKKFLAHYVVCQTPKGPKKSFVRCVGAGCPVCQQGEVKPSNRYYLKIFDRASGSIRVWEFGSQVKTQLDDIRDEVKKESEQSGVEDSWLNYQIVVKLRPKGSNPLYIITKGEKLTPEVPSKKAILDNDKKLIEQDEIDIEFLAKPWTLEKVNYKLYGPSTETTPTDTPTTPPSATPKSTPKEEVKSEGDSWLDD
jgi:hypothetical protein